MQITYKLQYSLCKTAKHVVHSTWLPLLSLNQIRTQILLQLLYVRPSASVLCEQTYMCTYSMKKLLSLQFVIELRTCTCEKALILHSDEKDCSTVTIVTGKVKYTCTYETDKSHSCTQQTLWYVCWLNHHKPLLVCFEKTLPTWDITISP